jgi:hypothetical protein
VHERDWQILTWIDVGGMYFDLVRRKASEVLGGGGTSVSRTGLKLFVARYCEG